MGKRASLYTIIAVVLCFVFSVFSGEFSLTEFFAEKEGYSWRFEKQEKGNGFTTHFLRLRSQTWQNGSLVDHPVWEHEIRLTIPARLHSPHALVHILGGSANQSSWETPPLLLDTAVASETILAEISCIPVQPLVFSDESKRRVEDAIIAYSWRKFLETNEPSWPVHLPMAKAITRAMDCIQEYCQQQNISIPKQFVLTGESKRAWAAWLAAAADSRVCGLIPISCDFLHVKACFINHYRSLGTWSIAIREYLAEGIDERVLNTPSFDALMQIEDPYSYRNTYTMPKFLVQASGDPFSSPDSSWCYYSDLPSPKYLRYLPNVGHRIPPEEMAGSIHAFYLSLIGSKPLPQLLWKREEDHSLTLLTDVSPLKLTVWRAANSDARDFRLDFTKVRWEGQPIPISEKGKYKVLPSSVDKGWAAFFVEAVFPGPSEEKPLIFTTEVVITPDEFPFSLSRKAT